MTQGDFFGSGGTPDWKTVRTGFSEDSLVEQPAIQEFDRLGWETANLYHEWASGRSTEGRRSERDVILVPRLRVALEKLNPGLPSVAIEQAIEELTRDRSKMVPAEANREVYRLLKDGVPARITDEHGGSDDERLRVIDWRDPANNAFLLASQFWIAGELGRKRADLIGFVNGIPLVFIELKTSHKNVYDAYKDNLSDYRTTIPHVFAPNGLIILSNGSETLVGSTTAPWEHFNEWKRVSDEEEEGIVSLQTVIRGLCDRERLLDIVENFTVYEEARGGLIKILAKNHQYLGVTRAIAATRNQKENEGRLGVFWHTQGSGKSYSMVFFTQKILRTLPGNWTFLIVTDRDELDGQIYKTFARTGTVTEAEERCHARSGRHLQELLTEDHRYLFTLIQKFRTNERGETYPMLSDREDIIVITDEAHRSQYDIFALNMRNALPEASFIGFTGTPLIKGEEQKTREVFGDYVSVYNFARSIEDKATVPLYYENRIPELQLTNENLNEDLERLLEEAELDEEQERKLEREFAREYHLITRDDRQETVAKDIVRHFVNRGYRGKGMVISIDKATAVRTYDKVRAHWQAYLEELKAELTTEKNEDKRAALEARIQFMESTDMAVVVSQSQNEITQLAAKGLDMTPHRKRIVAENLDEKFKDPDDPFRLVFVCAMWITGFDVPTCSTIYLDKPMRNHTLMQTIARANRVAPGKEAGLIVDYVGVFKNLQKALAIYATSSGGDTPIKDKQELVELLKTAVDDLIYFCSQLGIDVGAIIAKQGFERIGLLDDAVEKILQHEDDKKRFMQSAALVARLFRAILPDPIANELAAPAITLTYLADKIKSLAPPTDISAVMGDVERLLDDSIATEGYRIPAEEAEVPLIDLSQVDWDALRKKFEGGRKRTEVERLRAAIGQQLQEMVRRNRSRIDLLEKFQQMIADYNAGSRNVEEMFEELMRFVRELDEEQRRGVAEGLSEEELALFDILTKPAPKLTEKDRKQVKAVIRELLETLKAERLVLDWRSRQQSQAAVRQAIEIELDKLPEAYEADLYQTKCDLAFKHVFDSYAGPGESVYV